MQNKPSSGAQTIWDQSESGIATPVVQSVPLFEVITRLPAPFRAQKIESSGDQHIEFHVPSAIVCPLQTETLLAANIRCSVLNVEYILIIYLLISPVS